MVLLVTEKRAAVAAKSKIDIGLRQFPNRYWNYLLATALFVIGNSSNAFLILQTQDIGASLETTILIYAAFNLVAALISYPAGALSDQWGRRNVLLASFVVFFIAYLGFAATRNVVLIATLFILYGLYQGIIRAVGKALASDLVPEHWRAAELRPGTMLAFLASRSPSRGRDGTGQGSLDCVTRRRPEHHHEGPSAEAGSMRNLYTRLDRPGARAKFQLARRSI